MVTVQSTAPTTTNKPISHALLHGPKLWLHLEGFAVLATAVILYAQYNYSWWLFAALILAPDLAMVGYLANARIGGIVYNIFHNYLVVLAFLQIAYFTASPLAWAIGFIWMAHIGLDRLTGYGLKYDDQFKHTHMDEV
jgi:hypothetical protein